MHREKQLREEAQKEKEELQQRMQELQEQFHAAQEAMVCRLLYFMALFSNHSVLIMRRIFLNIQM